MRVHIAWWTALLVLVGTAACGGDPPYESPPPFPAPDVMQPTVTGVSPLSGAPNSQVRVAAAGFPASSFIRIGFGRPGSDYDVLATQQSDPLGNVTANVRVPLWADPGVHYVFVVADTDNLPSAISNRFLVTAPSGPGARLVRVQGRITAEGVECLAMRDSDGTLYTLTGREVRTLRPGDRVIVEGETAQVSTCMQGTTISVRSVEQIR